MCDNRPAGYVRSTLVCSCVADKLLYKLQTASAQKLLRFHLTVEKECWGKEKNSINENYTALIHKDIARS
jgi:hypothetical protein